MVRGRPSSAPGERGKGVLRSFLPRSERARKRSDPGEEVMLAGAEPNAEKVRSLTLLSADIQRRNVVGLVGLTLGWRRGALDTASTSDSALTMLRLSVNVHLTTRGRKVDYARSFCFALGHEVGGRPTGLTDRTVDAVAGIEGLRGFENEPRLAVTSGTAPEEAPPPRDTTVTATPPQQAAEPLAAEPLAAEPLPAEPPRVEASPAPQVVPRREEVREAPRVSTPGPTTPPRDERPTESGWYPDPVHHAALRFWDGHRWTSHVSGDGRMWLSPIARRDRPR
ncbi:MAG TPA: DUF2510 domain-containing protein [Acidimicrobiia bacterium]|jgi:hypothetical protein